MFVAIMAFFAKVSFFSLNCNYSELTTYRLNLSVSIKVSDPAVGGTYMTLLNTVCNFGGNWPSTLALWSVDSLTWKSCQGSDLQDNTCLNQAETLVRHLFTGYNS